MDIRVKREILDATFKERPKQNGSSNATVILVSSSSDSDSVSDSDGEGAGAIVSSNGVGFEARASKKRKLDELGVELPVGFLAPLPPLATPVGRQSTGNEGLAVIGQSCKQFWKAGDYEGAPCGDWEFGSGGMDHVRVHPKFLHSNATSHKWALGAFAELLDNSLDEVCNGATYVNVDTIISQKDGSRMLLIEDNGGGMDPDKIRRCMSLGYSEKSKLANTIGQYGNGFKTSTMRLGADVIVFSCTSGRDGKSPTQSIGLLSYTFLRSTGKEDIVVPMLSYERNGGEWKMIIRSSAIDWSKNVDTIVQWSPFHDEVDLLCQFNLMKDQGTRIIIYNLWEDDQGFLELDFDADQHDIQLRGVNRDEKKIQMAKEFPNSRHFLTYRHSLRSYASILYLRLPPHFRVILRGKDVEHHNIVNDMMMSQEITYRPNPTADVVPKNVNMAAVVTIGFVKDARFHIDVQGFNVYHKNRLIKPFWRLWNAAGSDGRGVIGVLEANFVEPAHDKQGFERTTVLARLESKLINMQKTYWSSNCHKIGYAPRLNKRFINESLEREESSDYLPHTSGSKRKKASRSRKLSLASGKSYLHSNQNGGGKGDQGHGKGAMFSKESNNRKKATTAGRRTSSFEPSSPSAENVSNDRVCSAPPERKANGCPPAALSSSYVKDTGSPRDCASVGRAFRAVIRLQSKGGDNINAAPSIPNSDLCTVDQLKKENSALKKRLEKNEGEARGELMRDLQYERDRIRSLETQLQAAENKIEDLNREQESLIDIFSEERERRDKEEENLRRKLKDASNTIQELLDKVRLLEKLKSPNFKRDH
ncbi:putative zinc finger protein [Tripterygium wilfordii]|uniref:Putative zinc finger protein n=1 Tax=Tripterygium wilfordii TaxID=458696 RepID=A0A7J7CE78_TRIWF|nr:protein MICRORCHIDIA 4-like [Tripterygium wilfordii]KAF5732235.1 putative zinc finger protein [Tripterygium wilfordii]